ncbi:GIY-YIG nuclease family protein [Puniceicoccus vermicola]|uniref:Putative endonuclease SegE-like GIY-YIG domain-containing protein n=1 Tax=Puniceicoccus vermicola TaxID=388746 RepID=A0A7X1AY62_9BACT|nr:hypothetical protein [Puniceicoccus vermicola]MBC2602069.1 hypothetical protein [Puniceicoccus vermicola]
MYGHWDISEVGEFDPANFFGFVYQISLWIGGETFVYIGRKAFSSSPKWQNYKSSSSSVKNLRREAEKVEYTILELAKTKRELTYLEAKYLFTNNVLESDRFLNRNILGRFFSQK